MRFTFLHAADLHLGSPLAGLAGRDLSVARRIALAGREAFSALVDRALDEKVAFVLLAGDIYDREWQDNAIGLFFNKEVARLHRDGIPVFMIRGNHDAASVVTRTITLPQSVGQFSTRKAETLRLDALRVAVHGRSFPDRAVEENIALDYPDPIPGWFNIGLLHTSLDGRPGHAPYAPCSLSDLRSRGYDYWALGHVHEHEVVATDPHVVYPGNIQGRSVRECGAKGAVLVDVEDGRVVDLRRILTARAEWAMAAVDLTGIGEGTGLLAAVEAAVAQHLPADRETMLVLRVTLTGATALHLGLSAHPETLRTEIQAAADRVHGDVWVESVKLATREPASSVAGPVDTASFGALLARIGAEPAFRERIAGEIAIVSAKLPPIEGAPPLADDLHAIVEEARALVLGRVAGPGAF
ncbi:metallophosphoesterase family protein [Prosthecomicrobium hirschii]|uniref:metallophosphoesterase family protein n=1 Tax=Prosthecodimorpha hirschii TaxID=665126 RepID=UPI002220A32C|nr:DNA repair exonuclease [Prosthecomicrobium hirschii]MCW1841455.1 DNA repair exonuclease [Prosthecomicrobium hirschii]